MNPLAAWLAQQPDGTAAKRRLSEATRKRWQTIHLIAENRQVPTPDTAAAIERGTGGEVRAVDLLAWFVEHPRTGPDAA
jgi:hypothetical protein